MLTRRFILRDFRVALVALLALLFVLVHPSNDVFAKSKKAKYGTLKILTTPGGLLLTIDGKPRGETTTEYRAIDLEPGVHNVVVRLPNGRLWVRDIEVPAGRIKCVVVHYRPLPTPPKSPCPFPVDISAPKYVNEGEIITYTTDVTYGGTAALNYKWTISPASARIISGAGSPTINVDSTGLGGQRIIATLVVDDGSEDPACQQIAQGVSVVNPEEKKIIVAREFDECNSCTFDDQKARLDNLAVELQHDPTTRGYIIAYGGRTSPVGQVQLLITRARDYLILQRGIDASRIEVINGGFREEDSVELWVVPGGAAPPRATPTVQASEIKPSGAPRRRRD